MGPTILLDKSAIQSLSENELHALSKYYTLNVPYHLYLEILTDLSKKKKDRDYKTQVIHLANKLNPTNYNVNIHYSKLIEGELMGNTFPLSYRAIVRANESDKTEREDGKKGIFLRQTKEELDIERWKAGNFTEKEMKIAEEQRNKIENADLNLFKKNIEHNKRNIKEKVDTTNLKKIINERLEFSHLSPLEKYDLLEPIMNFVHIETNLQNKIKERWYNENNFDLNLFAPYTIFCHKIIMYFGYGLMYNLITTRSSNLIDLEYLFYLPFCFIFSSGDKFHINSFDTLKFGNQFFLSNEDLKKELEILGYNIKEQENKDFYIPPNSITYKIYEEFKKIEGVIWDEDIDFIAKEIKVSIYSPCPCGSGKKLKDCCYEKIKKAEEKK